MKYQCTVCGQMIDQDDCCPICGSDNSKIIELGDDKTATSYRCLSCGRIFENKDICPFCGGEELFDLTHDCMFNHNEVNKKEENKETETETVDLFSQTYEEPKEEYEDKFDDEPVDVSKYEEIVPEKEEEVIDNSSLINEDPQNTEIIVEEEIDESNASQEVPIEETIIEPTLEKDTNLEDTFINIEAKDEEKVMEINTQLVCEKEETVLEETFEEEKIDINASLRRQLARISLLYSLLVEKDKINNGTKEKEEVVVLIEEIKKTLKEDKVIELNNDLLTSFKNLVKCDEEIFSLDKTPYNGYILYKDQETLKKLEEIFKK